MASPVPSDALCPAAVPVQVIDYHYEPVPCFQTLAHMHRAAQTTELIMAIIAHRKDTLTQSI